MARGDVIVNMKTLDTLITSGVMDKRTAKLLSDAIRKQSIDFMRKGISPVQGVKRYAAYKDPKKYPGKRKPKTPVNLKLSGDLYRSLGFKFIKFDKLIFGIFSSTAKGDVLDYAAVHNGDVRKKGTTPRPFIPTSPGSSYKKTILDKVRTVIIKRIDAIIKNTSR